MEKTDGSSRRGRRVPRPERETHVTHATEGCAAHSQRTFLTTPYEIGELLNIAGHDLRSPLSPMKMRLQHARRRLEREGGRERDVDDLSKALYHLDRVQQRIGVYLDAVALMEGIFTLAPRVSDLSEAARRITDSYANADTDRIIRLEDTGETLTGVWDSSRLDIVLRELLGNALKYANGDITVRLARQEAFARVEVEDMGPGLSGDLLSRIFEPYTTGVQGNHGLGLGLYVAREVVRCHGGELGVRSCPSGGLLFWLTLPLSD